MKITEIISMVSLISQRLVILGCCLICLSACSKTVQTQQGGGGSVVVGNSEIPEFVIVLPPIRADGSLIVEVTVESTETAGILYRVLAEGILVAGPIELTTVLNEDLAFQQMIPASVGVAAGDMIRFEFERPGVASANYQGQASSSDTVILVRENNAGQVQQGTAPFDSTADPINPTTVDHDLSFASGQPGAWLTLMSDMIVGDLDSDGYEDIIEFSIGGQLAIYWNNGTGQFDTMSVISSMIALPGTRLKGQLADLDNDGDHDIILTTTGVVPAAGLMVYWNQGVRQFSATGWSHFMSPAVIGARNTIAEVLMDLTVVDYDNDGDYDLAERSSGHLIIYKNDGSGQFSFVPQPPIFPTIPLAPTIVQLNYQDIDQDNQVELVENIYGFGGGSFSYLYEQGGETYIARTPLPQIAGDQINQRQFVDFDQNGDRDLLVITQSGQDYIAWNDGTHLFANAAYWEKTMLVADNPNPLDYSLLAKAADIDNDGDLDLIVGKKQSNLVFINQGNHNFSQQAHLQSPASINGPTINMKHLNVVDIDADGDLDIIESKQGSYPQLWRNQLY